MNAGKLWQDLVKVALVGSDRQTLSLPPGGTEPLAKLLEQVEAEPPAAYLLRLAGTVAVYQQAGFRPPPLNLAVAISPAPQIAEDLPTCGPLARRLLGKLLAGEHKEVFPEYLERVAAAGQRVSAELLPQLLDRGKRESQLRPLILSAIGTRGRWLAAHNPDWAYAAIAEAAELDLEIWQTGNKQARLSLLREIRQQDPERARELVISTWKAEKADARTAQLEILANNLSMADEPWLETLLDDRSKQVRRASAELLAKLPESQLCQRTIARSIPLLVFQDGQSPTLAVAVPTDCDAAMERDGILAEPPRGTGKKAWWLQQMLGIVPPSYWCQHWQTTPQTLLQSADSKWQATMVKGWVDAVRNHQDADWAEALLQPEFFKFLPALAQLVMPVLPRARQQALCLKLLQIPPQDLAPDKVGNFLACDLLEHCQGPWSLELIDAAIAYLGTVLALKDDKIRFNRIVNCLSALALCFPSDSTQKAVETTERITQIVKETQPSYHLDYYLQPLRECLEFRQQLHQAFPQPPATV